MSKLNVADIDAVLPQTQCRRCSYDDCNHYAQAIATDNIPINQCQPGGQEGILRLAKVTTRPVIPLNPDYGFEAERSVAYIDEAWCIGCTLCVDACPVDAIIGSNKTMHTIQESACTGCELCIPVCPVDCIELEIATPARTGWQAWSIHQANEAKTRYQRRQVRKKRLSEEQEQKFLQIKNQIPTHDV
jgi:electron transport complex protein RnfB